MVQADVKVKIDEATNAPFTHFEELQKRVELLQQIVNEHASILRQNRLHRTEEIAAPYFDEDMVYQQLEEDASHGAIESVQKESKS
jgi:hypothetical protein